MEWYLHMSVKTTETARLLDLAQKQPILRVRDVVAARIHPEHLRRLWRKGVMERTSRGVYRWSGPQSADVCARLNTEVLKRVMMRTKTVWPGCS
jgi:predicted transcriptional regulator of viral defense system